MKTTVSIPDDVFRRAERLAEQAKLTRSDLYTLALVQMLAADPSEDVTRAYDSAFDDGYRDFIDTAAQRRLAGVEWAEE